MLIRTVAGVVYIRASSVQWLLLPTSLPVFVVIPHDCPSDWGEVESQGVLVWIYLMAGEIEHLPTCLFISHFYFISCTYFFNIFTFSCIAGDPTQTLAHVRPCTLSLNCTSSLDCQKNHSWEHLGLPQHSMNFIHSNSPHSVQSQE